MSRYKLINNKTKEETICSLVTIDGFDYYVSDESLDINISFWGYCWNWYDKIHFFKNGLNQDASGKRGIQKIIATNNPNTDIPKVIDYSDPLNRRELIYKINNITAGSNKNTIIHVVNFENKKEAEQWCNGATHLEIIPETIVKAKETYQYTENDMIEFAMYCISFINKHKYAEVSDLLSIWKEQQLKIIYYE